MDVDWKAVKNDVIPVYTVAGGIKPLRVFNICLNIVQYLHWPLEVDFLLKTFALKIFLSSLEIQILTFVQ